MEVYFDNYGRGFSDTSVTFKHSQGVVKLNDLKEVVIYLENGVRLYIKDERGGLLTIKSDGHILEHSINNLRGSLL